MDDKPLDAEYRVDIVLGIVLSVLTCGIYNVIWNRKQFAAMNVLLGREEFKFWTWVLLSLLTCGIFHIYYEYKMGRELQAYLLARGVNSASNLSLLGVLLSCLGLTVVVDAIYQNEFNRLTR